MTLESTPMSAEYRADIDSMIHHPIGRSASLLDGNDAVHLWHELRRVEGQLDIALDGLLARTTDRDDLRGMLDEAADMNHRLSLERNDFQADAVALRRRVTDLRRHLAAARAALEHLLDGDQCRECRALNPDKLGVEDYYRLMAIHDERIASEALAALEPQAGEFLVTATYLNEPSELSKRLNPQVGEA